MNGPAPERGGFDAEMWDLIHQVMNEFDPVRERDRSLKRPVTPGARLVDPVLDLKSLSATIRHNPGSAVIVSDLHSQYDLLEYVLSELGLVSKGKRTKVEATLVSVGDLIDGRDLLDEDTLRFGAKVFDRILVGNHEAAFMGSRTFGGQPRRGKSALSYELKKLSQSGILVPGYLAHGVLVTHAGIGSERASGNSPEAVMHELLEAWKVFLSDPRDPAAHILTQGSRARGAEDTDGNAGCFWRAWTELLSDYPKGFRQIVGHSPLGRIEQSEDGLIFNIDAAGYRLGIAVVTPSGAVQFGSDFQV